MSDLISEYRILSSRAGFYVGLQYYDIEIGDWLPYDRFSEYFKLGEEILKLKQSFVLHECEDDDEEILTRVYFDDPMSFWHNLENFS